MKIIISHDVDHLFGKDHCFDLIYPKLWVRSTLEFLKRYYGFSEWLARMCSPFKKKRHNIEEIMRFDTQHSIPSTFFFGMKKGLGMAYSKKDAGKIIKIVQASGFDVGVHGVSYNCFEEMKAEYDSFRKIVGKTDFGIRMHYVRFDDSTFNNLAKCGYLFDSTEFNKKKGHLIKKPYKVDAMYEFPLCIMDGYLSPLLEDKIAETKELIMEAEKNDLPYLTILFHDYQFSKAYNTEKQWYVWVVKWLEDNGYKFISYRDAILEMDSVKK